MQIRFFGQYLLSQGYVTAPMLVAAIEHQREHNLRIGDLAVVGGLITRDQAERIHAHQLGRDLRYGALAVEMQLLLPEQVEGLLLQQRTGHVRLGEALQTLGFLTQAQVERALGDYALDQSRCASEAAKLPTCIPAGPWVLRTLELTERILLRAWGLRAKRGGFSIRDNQVLLSDRNAYVGVAGAFNAGYVLAVPDGIARAAAQKVVHCDTVSPEEQDDVVRELANVVCGHLVASLANEGKHSEISPPASLPFCWELDSATTAVQIPLLTHQGQVFLVLSLPRS